MSASLASKYLVHLSQFDIPYQTPSHCCPCEGHESEEQPTPKHMCFLIVTKYYFSFRLAILKILFTMCVCVCVYLELYFLANCVVFNHFLTLFFFGGGHLTVSQSVLSPNAWEIKGRLSKEPC